MLRVLMTTDTVGGVWNYTSQLTEELTRRDIAVALVSIGRKPNQHQQQWLTEAAEQAGGNFHHEHCEAPLEWMNDNERAYQDGAPLLMEVARAFKATLLHSNQFCFGSLGVSIPRLVVAHSDVLSWMCACRGSTLQTSTGAAATHSPWLNRYTSLVMSGLYGADMVVAPTQWMLAALSSHFPIAGECCVISNGRTLRRTASAPERKLQAVSAGRLWDEAKNLKLLATGEWPIPLLIAGETGFESATTHSPEHPGSTLLGPLAEDALMNIFEQSAIYICPSLYEPFGLAPLEAALCGCAVVAHDIPSLREVWGAAALYFEDATTLAKLLARLAAEPEELAAAQQRSLNRAQQYSAQTMADRYVDLYQSMIPVSKSLWHVA